MISTHSTCAMVSSGSLHGHNIAARTSSGPCGWSHLHHATMGFSEMYQVTDVAEL